MSHIKNMNEPLPMIKQRVQNLFIFFPWWETCLKNCVIQAEVIIYQNKTSRKLGYFDRDMSYSKSQWQFSHFERPF